MSTTDFSVLSRLHIRSKEDMISGNHRSFDIDARFGDFCGVLGLDRSEAGGKITFVGADPILPSRHRLGACISIPIKFSETNGFWEDPVVAVRGSCKPEWKRSLEPSESNGIGGHP